jgi:hypothetical protein
MFRHLRAILISVCFLPIICCFTVPIYLLYFTVAPGFNIMFLLFYSPIVYSRYDRFCCILLWLPASISCFYYFIHPLYILEMTDSVVFYCCSRLQYHVFTILFTHCIFSIWPILLYFTVAPGFSIMVLLFYSTIVYSQYDQFCFTMLFTYCVFLVVINCGYICIF